MVSYFLLLLLPLCLARNTPRLERISPDLPQLKQSPAYTEMWFQEALDHINRDPGYINIRVLKVKSPYSTSTGPLIIYTGNEGPIEQFYNMSGFITTVLPNYWNCTIYFLEHRYYGESQPNPPFSWQYLNTEQVLFDYADIIQQLKPSNSTPVIVMGGSYGGMLAAWMRMKYTHIVDGAIASSAPVLMGLDNGEGYFTNVSQVLNYYGCGSLVQQALTTLTNLLNEPDLYNYLIDVFHPCSQLLNGTDLINWIVDAFAGVVQSNYPGYSDVDMPLSSWPANLTCQYFINYIQNPNPSPIALVGVLAQSMQVYYNTSGSATCFDITSGVDAGDSWDYQTCTELWCPQGTNNISDVFPPMPWNSQAQVSYCQGAYGVTPRPSWVQTNYGMNVFYQNAINAASNIFFVNGQLDPWLYGCVTSSKNRLIYTHTIAGGAHHTDLRAPTPQDPADVNSTRTLEIQQITKWVNAKTLQTRTPKTVSD